MRDGSPLIGLLTSSLKAPFVDRAVSGVCEVFAEKGAVLKAFEIQGVSPLEYHQFIERVAAESELDGLIYCHLRLNISQVGRFRSRGLPLVAVTERLEGVDWVTVDEVQGAYVATKHLLDLGHQRIALLNGPLLSLQARLREDGFLRALKEAGLKVGREQGVQLLNFAEAEAFNATQMLLDLPHPPTAIFCAAGDLAARGAIAALHERGLKVPGDVSVVGFDGLYFSRDIDLTTVEQPLEAMGRWAAERILQAVAEGSAHRPSGELFEPKLLVRSSTAPARPHDLAPAAAA